MPGVDQGIHPVPRDEAVQAHRHSPLIPHPVNGRVKPGHPGTPLLDPAGIDAILAAGVARGAVAGVVALATDRAGPIYQGAFGLRALGAAPVAMSLDTAFWIASMTKALAAAACMQLVEQGRLHLDRPVREVLPALAAPRILEGFDVSGTPRLRPARNAITLRHLLTHSSGFAYGMWHAEMARYERQSGIPRAETFASAQTCLPLAFEPGTGWAYGVGIDWAGKALEAVTGQTLDAYLREHVLGPLGMDDTGFLLMPGISGRVAGMHRRQADGTLAASPFEPPQNPAQFTGGGGMYATGPDYLRFVRMMLNGGVLDGTRVLRSETVALMAADSLAPLTVRPMRSAIPALTNDVDLYPDMAKGWGLSFLITPQDVPGARHAGSLAWAGLFNTYYWIDPAAGLGGVLLAQVQPFADRAVLDLLDAFERAVYAGRAAEA
jgi:CubicO group peptidase (beta-lactamase class C family)